MRMRTRARASDASSSRERERESASCEWGGWERERRRRKKAEQQRRRKKSQKRLPCDSTQKSRFTKTAFSLVRSRPPHFSALHSAASVTGIFSGHSRPPHSPPCKTAASLLSHCTLQIDRGLSTAHNSIQSSFLRAACRRAPAVLLRARVLFVFRLDPIVPPSLLPVSLVLHCCC